MKRTQGLRVCLVNRLPLLVGLLFWLQPVLDCLSYWLEQWGRGNLLTLGLRLLLLAGMVLAAFALSRRRRVWWVTAGVCLLLWLGHLWAVLGHGPQNLFRDLTNYIRVLQMPLTALCLITFLQENEGCYAAMKWGASGSLAVILLVTALASLTGTEPHTYMDGIGILGWFQNTNAQSSILSMVVPVTAARLYEKKGPSSPWFWLGLLGGYGVLYLLGTRLAFFAMAATGLGLGFAAVWQRTGQWRSALALVLPCLALISLVPLSPMALHQAIYASVQSGRQAQIDGSLKNYVLPSLEEDGLSEAELAARKALWVEALTPIYRTYAPDFVALFGAERTIEMYDYATEIGVITEQRPKKLRYARLLMEDASPGTRLFGLELDRFLVGDHNYDVENDFHGIYYLYGAVGLGLLLAFLGWFFRRILRSFLRRPRRWLTLDRAAWGIALGCGLLHALFTAGVLRRPNASFYLAAALAALWHLTRTDHRPINAAERP